MTLTDEAKAVVALTTRLGSRQRPSLTAKMWHDLSLGLADAGHDAADVFDPAFDVTDVPGVDQDLADRIDQLMSDSAAALLEVDELQQRGIWTTTIFDDGYPPLLTLRLGYHAPPVLFGSGNVSLLDRPGVGIVGSRNVSEAGGEVAMAFARHAVDLDLPVVSGGARGVDQLAMNQAFAAGGSVIGVLADSLVERIRKPDILQALDEGNVCLLTQQEPSTGFSPASAMSRNKIVYGLSAVTVVVATDEDSGGTWAGAVEALRANNGVVAVWRGPGEGPGNQALEEKGAIAVTDPEALDELVAIKAPSEQMTLDLTS